MINRILLVAIASLGACWSGAIRAQACDTAIPIYPNLTDSGNSCGTNHLPQLNVGTVLTPGDDVVYRLYQGEDGATSAVLTSESGLALFLCRAPCGTSSECIAAGSTGVNTTVQIQVPRDDEEYYLIIDSQGSCGDYTLSTFGPLAQAGDK